jgi:hypothetical protein
MALIPVGSDLKGKNMAFRITRKVELASCSQNIDFGALLDHKTTIGDREFAYAGWFGPNGKTDPIVAAFTADPGKSKAGDTEKPSFHIFIEVDGQLMELAVAFKKEAKSGNTYYSGQTTGTPKINFAIFPHSSKSAGDTPIDPDEF